VGTLSLMELNTANYDNHPDWDERLPMIVDAVVACEASVVALSEIRYSPSNSVNTGCVAYWSALGIDNPGCAYQNMGDQILTLLRTKAGYESCDILTSRATTDSTPPGWEGLSILSVLPFRAGGWQRLRGGSDGNDRITQFAVVEVDGDDVYVFNTHWSLNEGDRPLNAQDTVEFMGRVAPAGTPFVLAGDFNTYYTGTPERSLKDLIAYGLRDAWPLVQPGDPGYTWSNPTPDERIDYVWVPAAVTPTQASLVATAPNENGVYASDHVGIHMTLTV
jgi:endonuclease/exonuclease/phosphatase family metal-dependent hydrolase